MNPCYVGQDRNDVFDLSYDLENLVADPLQKIGEVNPRLKLKKRNDICCNKL